jgi:hypothetical protein
MYMSTSKRGEKGRKIVLLNEVDWMACLIDGRRWERLSIGKNGGRIRRNKGVIGPPVPEPNMTHI